MDNASLLDDDYVFEPDAWDFAVTIGITPDPDQDRPALDELADAMLVWADEATLERLTDAAIERIWNSELAGMIREGLVRLSGRNDWETAAITALEEFDRSPISCPVSREVVRHLAMQLGSADHPVFFCVCCIEEQLTRADASERRAHAVRVAIVAARDAAVPVLEIQDAISGALRGSPATRLGTHARRAAVRARLGRLGRLARESMPDLAAELQALADEPLPERAEEDDVWREVCDGLLAEAARPELN